MNKESKREFIDDVWYFYTYKGDIERMSTFTIDKLREANPALAKAYEDMQTATEIFEAVLDKATQGGQT